MWVYKLFTKAIDFMVAECSVCCEGLLWSKLEISEVIMLEWVTLINVSFIIVGYNW